MSALCCSNIIVRPLGVSTFIFFNWVFGYGASVFVVISLLLVGTGHRCGRGVRLETTEDVVKLRPTEDVVKLRSTKDVVKLRLTWEVVKLTNPLLSRVSVWFLWCGQDVVRFPLFCYWCSWFELWCD